MYVVCLFFYIYCVCACSLGFLDLEDLFLFFLINVLEKPGQRAIDLPLMRNPSESKRNVISQTFVSKV